MKSFLLVVAVFLLVLSGVVINHFQFERALKEITTKAELRQMAWQVAVNIHEQTNTITTDVGVIQFLDKGFSISLDSADWKTEGLVLTGKLGNSNNLQVSSLTLKIIAQKSMYSLREEFIKSESIYPSYIFAFPEQIGTGQASVGNIESGRMASFKITIPNVRPTEEDLVFIVSFSGERYAYYDE